MSQIVGRIYQSRASRVQKMSYLPRLSLKTKHLFETEKIFGPF